MIERGDILYNIRSGVYVMVDRLDGETLWVIAWKSSGGIRVVSGIPWTDQWDPTDWSISTETRIKEEFEEYSKIRLMEALGLLKVASCEDLSRIIGDAMIILKEKIETDA